MSGLIDYAGLFPPAALDMKTAVANYTRYLAGPDAWALGRFVLPVARFAEFEAAITDVHPVEPWGISALIGANYDSDLAEVDRFNQRNARKARVDSVEAKASSTDEICQIRAFVRGTITPYFEIPPDKAADLLGTIRDIRGRAKIRTGGVTPEAFPSSDQVANFIAECAERKVGFKATAGLHHPVRCKKPLTYDPHAPEGVMHGFLNVFLLAVYTWAIGKTFRVNDDFLVRGRPMVKPFEYRIGESRAVDEAAPELGGRLTRVVAHEADSSVDSTGGDKIYRKSLLNRIRPFIFQDWGLEEPFSMPTTVITQARRDFAISFGSCSFEEPLADLRELKLL